jgi:tetratricopeptide (TPR) repeat protein
MSWAPFPYPDPAYTYDRPRLKAAWSALHAGDLEPWPDNEQVLDAWIAFHAGDFESAARQGLDAGMCGYAVANKAACVHAVYLEKTEARRLERLLQVAGRCEQQQAAQPRNAAGFYWHGYALCRHAQQTSISKALAEGSAARSRASLETTLKLAPRHADAHVALGGYHAQVIDKVDELAARLTYSVSRDEAMRHFQAAIELSPDMVAARIAYADALVMLDGAKKAKQASALRQHAAAMTPRDAMERLAVERAREGLPA